MEFLKGGLSSSKTNIRRAPSSISNDLLNSSALAFLACVSQNYRKLECVLYDVFQMNVLKVNFSTPLEDHSTSLLPYNKLTSNHTGGYFYERGRHLLNKVQVKKSSK